MTTSDNLNMHLDRNRPVDSDRFERITRCADRSARPSSSFRRGDADINSRPLTNGRRFRSGRRRNCADYVLSFVRGGLLLDKYDDVDDDDERRKNWPRTAQPHAAPLAAACRLPSTTALHRRMHFRAASTRRRLTTWRKMRFESFDSDTVGRRPEETDVRRLEAALWRLSGSGVGALWHHRI